MDIADSKLGTTICIIQLRIATSAPAKWPQPYRQGASSVEVEILCHIVPLHVVLWVICSVKL
jgi:hypothetical protein